MRAGAGFDLREVERITVEGGIVHAMLAEPPASKRAPSTAIDAKFSLPFTVATALVRGNVTLDSFTPAALEDAEVLGVAARVDFLQRAEWGRGQAVCGAVALHLKGGSQQRIAIEVPQGAPARPLSDASLIAKFVDCVGRAAKPLGSAAAHALALRLLDLAAEPDVNALI